AHSSRRTNHFRTHRRRHHLPQNFPQRETKHQRRRRLEFLPPRHHAQFHIRRPEVRIRKRSHRRQRHDAHHGAHPVAGSPPRLPCKNQRSLFLRLLQSGLGRC